MKKEKKKKNHTLHLSINGKQYEWHKEYISGAEIRKLGNIPTEDEIFLSIKDWPDEPIPDDKEENLARPGIEHFYSKKPGCIIIVNTRDKEWKEKKISYKQVIELAYVNYVDNGTVEYSVTYKNGPEQN